MDKIIAYLEGRIASAQGTLNTFNAQVAKEGLGFALEYNSSFVNAAAQIAVATAHLKSIRDAQQSGHSINEVLYLQNLGIRIIEDAAFTINSCNPVADEYKRECRRVEVLFHQHFTRGF